MDLMRFQQSQEVLKDQKLVRPTPQEREAISKLLETKPRPKTFNEADIKYLKGLLDRATWLGAERRIMHEMWTEVTGKEWGASDAAPPKTSDAPP
jgi:hypothetical protein